MKPNTVPRAIGILAMLSATAATEAHPGVGIVQDSRENVFFTDLKQVWKIAPDGGKSVVVPGVHTHELCIDTEDNLYGEHLWGDGGTWRHRVWRLKRAGALNDVIPARGGFLRDYSFVRDGSGNMYWADRGEKTVIKKRSPDGMITTHATTDFHMVQRMAATPDGKLFLMDGGNLRQVSPAGKVTTLATNLSEFSPPPAAVSEMNYHMGLWTDHAGSVYVAVSRERLVLRVRADGTRKVVARSGEGWSPSGGMFDRAGSLWLLEYDPGNSVRARRIRPDGHDQIFSTSGN